MYDFILDSHHKSLAISHQRFFWAWMDAGYPMDWREDVEASLDTLNAIASEWSAS